MAFYSDKASIFRVNQPEAIKGSGITQFAQALYELNIDGICASGYWHYAMITPEGDEFWNRLDFQTIDTGNDYTARDGFCDETGRVNREMSCCSH